MSLKSFKPISDSLYEDSRRLNIESFAKNFSGRVTFVTLFSMNKTSTQSEFGQMSHSSSRNYTKVVNYPLWNVTQQDLDVEYDFENSGLAVPEVVTTGVTIDSIYTVTAGDLLKFNNYNGESKLFEVQPNESNYSMVEDYNLTKLNLKLVDKDESKILSSVNKELSYDFMTSILSDKSLINKYELVPEVVKLDQIISQFNDFINEDFNMSDGFISYNVRYYLFNLVENKYDFYIKAGVSTPVLVIDFEEDSITEIHDKTVALTNNINNHFLILRDMKESNIITLLAKLENNKLIVRLKE